MCLVTNPNVKFIDKNQWKSNLKCNVCSRNFEKLKRINEHHWYYREYIKYLMISRVCGYGVCGDCSKKRINSERACDICFTKQGIEVHEKRREEIIHSKSERVSKAQAMLQKKKEESAQVTKKVSDIKEDVITISIKYNLLLR